MRRVLVEGAHVLKAAVACAMVARHIKKCFCVPAPLERHSKKQLWRLAAMTSHAGAKLGLSTRSSFLLCSCCAFGAMRPRRRALAALPAKHCPAPGQPAPGQPASHSLSAMACCPHMAPGPCHWLWLWPSLRWLGLAQRALLACQPLPLLRHASPAWLAHLHALPSRHRSTKPALHLLSLPLAQVQRKHQ